MNLVVMSGRIVSDPEYKQTKSGTSVCNFRIAVERPFKNAEGKHDADFFPCVAWRGTADYLHNYFPKGRKVMVKGSLQTRNYDAPDGSKRYITEILVDSVEQADTQPRQQQQAPQPQEFAPADDGEPLPF